MPPRPRLMLRFADWPAEDQKRWEAAFKLGDRFDESGRGAHLAESTRQTRRENYGRYLGFLATKHPELMTLSPEARINRELIAEYISWRKRLGGEVSLVGDLRHLSVALKLICPDDDWSWLLIVTKRVAAAAPRQSRKYHLVTSDRLYALGIQLMERAIAYADASERMRTSHALQYRDGLIIAFLALIPLRRRTLAVLRIGHHLIKVGELWELEIPATDTKNRRSLDFPISQELSAHIDLYLERFREGIPGTYKHRGMWSWYRSRPMSSSAIYDAVFRRTKKAFGFGVNLHRFRHAAASFWSSHDPVNVRGAKDLLGQASFATTEKYYVMAQSRLAGRALARVIGNLGKRRVVA
jgi:integrase/recombinase XerD